jgi:uncharacterized protein (TIGR02265 family)
VEEGAIVEAMSMGMEASAVEVSPGFWERDLARRLSLATPADTTRGLFMRSTSEAILALGDEGLVRRCREACAYEQFVEFFHYPIRLQLQMMALALAPLAARHGCGTRSLRLLGRRGASAFLASQAGRMLLMLAGGERKRLMECAPMGFRMSSSYGKHTLRWTGPASVHWRMERVFMPYPFLEGVFLGVLESSGASNVRVVGCQTGALDSEYDISWE